MPGPIVRKARAGDAAVLAELSGQLGYPVGEQEMAARLASLAPSAQDAVLVAEDPADGRPLGWLHAGVRVSLESGARVEILGLVVSQEARGAGVGTALLAHAEQWARGTGHSEVLVRSQSKRTEAHHFYRLRGYSDLKTQNVFIKKLKTTPE